MRIVDKLRRRVNRLLTAPGEEVGRWGRLLRFQIRLWRVCAHRLHQNNAMAMSAALSFRTLFALVPALVLGLLAAQALGVLEDSKESLHQALTTAGIGEIALVEPATPTATAPAGGPPRVINAADKIIELVETVESKLSAGVVGPIGVVLLIWTVLTLLTTIERSLNRIFEAPRSRALGRRMLLYWSAVTLGPVLLAAAWFAGDQAVEAVSVNPVARFLLTALGWAGPVLMGIILLGALYKLMPNTHVRFSSALGGALVAVPLWLLAEGGFSLYVSGVVGRGSLYGALGLVPLFLFWVNLSWLIFLFGAQLAHSAVNLSRIELSERARHMVFGPAELWAASLVVAESYVAGKGPVTYRAIAGALELPDLVVDRLLERLCRLRIICPVESDRGGGYVLARPPERIGLLEVLEVEPNPAGNLPSGFWHRDPAAQRLRRRASESMGRMTLADVLGTSDDG